MPYKVQIDYSLYLVTDRLLLGGKDLAETIEQAILGGVTAVQLREKDVTSLDFYHIAQTVKNSTAKYGVPFIVNDRLDIALAVDADGLHIGQRDLPLPVARKLLGAKKTIGVSATTLEQALSAQEQGADYLGIGAMFPTATKEDADSVSLRELQRIKEQARIPIVAIGGIQANNIQQIIAAGADGAAVVSAIIAAADPRAAAEQLRKLIKP